MNDKCAYKEDLELENKHKVGRSANSRPHHSISIQ